MSHTSYMQTIPLFCEAKREKILYPRGILLAFEVSGLKINLTKSCIFSINADNMIEELADILGCRIEKFPTNYLGLPLGVHMAKFN